MEVKKALERPGMILGSNKLMRCLANTPYPPSAHEKGIEGTVYLEFIVDEHGNISRYNIIRSAHELLDNAALNRIKNFQGEWLPAIVDGEAVGSKYRVKIGFKLH